MSIPPCPDFASRAFLEQHIEDILAFYEPRVFDSNGGFFHHFLDDGNIYDHHTRHLVSSTRFVFNYANAFLQTGRPQYRDWTAHGLAFVINHHRHDNGHFVWQIDASGSGDNRALVYGHAFVMLAAAWAARLDIDGAAALISETMGFLEKYFWEAEHGGYADERDPDLAILAPYRGQNANMHMVEALLAAFDATGEMRYLERANVIAKQFTVTLADRANGQIWEHYNENWTHDWAYNKDKPDDLFKPWGFQPGHQIEWAKLLLQIDAHQPDAWHKDRAITLYHTAMTKGWDEEYGGLVYGYAPDGSFADDHKYYWVQAEAIAAAWRLYRLTGVERYRQDYIRLWTWSWNHLMDHQHGAWFRITSRQGAWIEPYKSPAGKTDYHTLGACRDVLAQMASLG